MECILQTLKTKLTCKPYRLLLTDGIPRLVFLLLSFTNVSFRYFSFQQGISIELYVHVKISVVKEHGLLQARAVRETVTRNG